MPNSDPDDFADRLFIKKARGELDGEPIMIRDGYVKVEMPDGRWGVASIQVIPESNLLDTEQEADDYIDDANGKLVPTARRTKPHLRLVN